ncbi:aminodeoxychorismate/anthranilate synthase component II [Bacillus spongiae]|uniref:Aminodeoxychorismate/anthranilate synthase component II n=1 Tax=Bacillus spongiae TaxID=2683610 RepID=A0ABU8HHV9_9BACI
MILLVDNYDSFTYNLYQYLSELGEDVLVKRNDEVTIQEVKEMDPTAIVLSPGPGTPDDAGICEELVQEFYQQKPILGICLGHQVIGKVFGAKVEQATTIRHGKPSPIQHNGSGLFSYLPSPLQVMRYHSLAVRSFHNSSPLVVTAKAMDDGEIMAIQHNHYPVFGLQFHPESIGTASGKKLLANFLQEITKESHDETVYTQA